MKKDNKSREKIYFAVVGMDFRYGDEFIEKDLAVTLEKEPDNAADSEAIMVKLPGLGKIGYVANSVHTVPDDCFSAGRLYDKIGDTAKGSVLFKFAGGAVCELVDVD